ncbi:uncharacterized protein TNIN_341111 [Trichonephila inaurata madagascariensis]|uniref:Uncharacterized protein n=1 Tax=Trichonephila inaurata madagascariensis TaxID=2747483 RepID=A0A8X6IVK6_9ARAC|nr:uncharacterized protein TNIN_341111 [Trichonephila inaurata madagascariensis]
MECRVATELKNKAYKNTIQRKYTRTAIDEYKYARKNEKKKIHRIKRNFHENLLMDVELLRGVGESRAFFRGRRSFKPRTAMCKGKDRNILSAKGDFFKDGGNT